MIEFRRKTLIDKGQCKILNFNIYILTLTGPSGSGGLWKWVCIRETFVG